MYVVHLELSEPIRTQLARLLGVRDGKLGGFQYFETDVPADVRRVLQANSAKVLVLDLGLKPAWDNKHLPAVLRHLAMGEDLPPGIRAADCTAHALTLMAHRHHVPCAVLTNYSLYTGGDPGLTEEKIREAFRAQAIFHKDGRGLSACARWVRGALGLEP